MKINCGHCGTPLDVQQGVNFMTCTNCQTPLKLVQTLTSSYTVPHHNATAQHVSNDLSKITLEKELERIDREWTIEREKYVIHGQRGTHTPEKNTSIIGGVIGGVFVIGFLLFTMSMLPASGPVGLFLVFGLIMLFFIVAVSVSGEKKATDYKKAEQEYLKRRQVVLDELEKLG